jgi:hypothetical protein
MKTFNETTLLEFEAWRGAVDTKNTILENNKENDFDALIEELYPDGLSETQLNDILWFDSGWILEYLGISQED